MENSLPWSTSSGGFTVQIILFTMAAFGSTRNEAWFCASFISIKTSQPPTGSQYQRLTGCGISDYRTVAGCLSEGTRTLHFTHYSKVELIKVEMASVTINPADIPGSLFTLNAVPGAP